MTNAITLVATLALLVYYFIHYVLKKPAPLIASVGLTLLTLGMIIDHVSWVYVVPTALSALFVGSAARPP